MKKLLRKITAVVSAAAVVAAGGIIGLSALAESDGVQTTLDIGKGSITITADSVSGYDSSGNAVTEVDLDGYIITGSTDTYTVTVSGTQKITLDNATINVSGSTNSAAFKIVDNNTGDITLTLVGTNTLTSGQYRAGLQKNVDSDGSGKLFITGTGSLSANGGSESAGIGGGAGYGTANIEINGGSITAAGNGGGAGVGSGFYTYNESSGESDYPYWDNPVISGGSLKASGSDKEGENSAAIGIGVRCDVISGANESDEGGSDYYYYSGDLVYPVDHNDNSLYLCEITNAGKSPVLIDGEEYAMTNHADEDNLYLYLADGNHYIKVGSTYYLAKPIESWISGISYTKFELT